MATHPQKLEYLLDLVREAVHYADVKRLDGPRTRDLVRAAIAGEPPSTLASTRGEREQLRCPARPLTGDLSCVYDAGHDQPHRNYQGIEWTMVRCDAAYVPGGVDETVTCRLPAGHEFEHTGRGDDGMHYDWPHDAELDGDAATSAPCDASVTVDYGENGYPIPCVLDADHPGRHSGVDRGAVVSW